MGIRLVNVLFVFSKDWFLELLIVEIDSKGINE